MSDSPQPQQPQQPQQPPSFQQKVIMETNYDSFTAKINALLQNGWRIQGSITYAHDYYSAVLIVNPIVELQMGVLLQKIDFLLATASSDKNLKPIIERLDRIEKELRASNGLPREKEKEDENQAN